VKESFPVLVVSGGGWGGLSLIRALRESEQVRILMVDCHEDNVARAFVDFFEAVPPIADEPAFLSALLALCDREKVRLILPSTPFELLALAAARDRFRSLGAELGVPDEGLLRLVLDKARLYDALDVHGVPVLRRFQAGDPLAPLPLIGKPIAGWGGRDIVVASSREDLARHQSEPRIWQKYLKDPEELSVDFSLDFEQRPSGFGIRKRLRCSGGFAVVTESVDVPSVRAVLPSLLSFLKGPGLYNVQLLSDGDTFHVSDLNPRLGTSAVHWRDSGFNPVLHLCASLEPGLRRPVRDPGEIAPRRVIRYLEEIVVENPPGARERERALEGVVFDLDDTLVSQKGWILARLERLWEARRDLPPWATALPELLRIVEEGPRDRLLDALVSRLGLKVGLTEGLIADYRRSFPDRCPVYKDVVVTLETLRRGGFKLGVLTDNPPDSQRRKVEASGLLDLFDAVIYARAEGGDKPDPAGFRAVASALSLAPERLGMVGDNPYRDIAGALEAGYGMAYRLKRDGGAFSFDPSLFGELLGASDRVRTIPDLHALLGHLEPLKAGRAEPGRGRLPRAFGTAHSR
jgi:FMN phosphatase YigB (HAD superfamily)